MQPELQEQTPNAAALREQLRHVYWLGGGSGAGKSTIAQRVADAHHLRLYSTDDVMPDHAKRTTPADAPFLAGFAAMDMDQRWVNRSPEDMLATFHWFHGEGFAPIIEDLLSLPREPGIIVEGFRLLPHLVQPLLADPAHAVWLLPTPEFRKAVFDRRGPAWGFLPKTSDPDRALHNLLQRDHMFTDRLRQETNHLELPHIEVNTTTTEDDLAKRVAESFGL